MSGFFKVGNVGRSLIIGGALMLALGVLLMYGNSMDDSPFVQATLAIYLMTATGFSLVVIGILAQGTGPRRDARLGFGLIGYGVVIASLGFLAFPHLAAGLQPITAIVSALSVVGGVYLLARSMMAR